MINDTETERPIVEELRNLRTLVRRFGLYFVALTLMPVVFWILMLMFMGATAGSFLGGAAKAISQQSATPSTDVSTAARKTRQMETEILQLALTVERLQDQLKGTQSLPRTPSGQVLYPGPSAPPKFPEGTRFVPDAGNPKGYRAVKE